MGRQKRTKVSENQLSLFTEVPPPPEKSQGKRKPRRPRRKDNLAGRVTRLEAEVALVRGQMERGEDGGDYDCAT